MNPKTNSISERLHDKAEAFRKLLDNFGTDLRVAVPGIVRSFNSSKQTVTVEVAIKESVRNGTEYEEVGIPILVDVPIFMPRAGGFALTLPIVAGDECLVIFADNCFDAWYQSGGVQSQMDRRRHDLSDGIALCGIWSQPQVIPSYSTTAAELRNESGSVKIQVKSDRVVVNAATVELGSGTLRKLIDERVITKLNNFISTVFNLHMHPTAGTGAPSVPTVLGESIVDADVTTTNTKAG